MTEKRVLLAAMLSVVFLAVYSRLVFKPMPNPAGLPAQSLTGQAEHHAESAAIHLIESEEVATIESATLKLEIGRQSGDVKSATLKTFRDEHGTASLRFGSRLPLIGVQLAAGKPQFRVTSESTQRVSLESVGEYVEKYNISYSLDSDNHIINMELRISGEPNTQNEPIAIATSWTKADALPGRYNMLETVAVSDKPSGKPEYKRYRAPFRVERIVPRGTRQLSLSERYFCLSLKPDRPVMVRMVPSTGEAIAALSLVDDAQTKAGAASFSAKIYLGPRDYFSMNRAGFGGAFPIGVLGQIGLIFLGLMSLIENLTHNYGMAIVLFSGFITFVMSPMTLISVRSMKKMQELKPKIDKIMAQHKGDQMRANKEVFELYREHKISPLSGCLPMLLQFPIFIALFQAMSHFVQLRGSRFLWIKDLSLPDRLAQLPVALPIIGKDVNLLPLIMALAMFLQTKMSQPDSSAAEANPSMKMMSGPMMPILFCVMFYSFPSGLVLYWLTNSLFSMTIYRLAK